MNIIVREDPKYTINSFLEKVYKLFPYSSRATINRSTFNDVLKIITNKPMLTGNWVVTVYPKGLSNAQLKELTSINNVNIYKITSKVDLETLTNTFKSLGILFKYVDTLNVPKEDIIAHVVEELNTTVENAKYICSRHRYYLPKILESVAILSTFDKIDKATIKEYTERFNTISLYDLVDYLLGASDNVNIKKVTKLLYDYRFGFEFLINFIKEELGKYNTVYSYIESGELSIANIKQFLEIKRTEKPFNNMTEYRLKHIISSYSLVSFDKLWFITLQVNAINSSKQNLYKLINLLKAGG